MENNGIDKFLRIGELSRRTGVSTSAINYYIREGLLPSPLKTAPNMAYYDPGYVQMINYIRMLRQEKGLPLSEIKELVGKGELKWPEGTPPDDTGTLTGGAAGTRRALDRQKHIMSVASRVFAEKGYHATTITDLAEAAGIAKGTIYWYFNNKRSIMIAILTDMLKEITLVLNDIATSAPTGLDAILNCVEPSLKLLDKHGPIYLMYFMEIGSTDRVIQEKFRKTYRVVHTYTKIALERGIEEGVVRKLDTDVAAYAVMGTIERMSQVGSLQERRIPVDVKISETRELLRRALAAKP